MGCWNARPQTQQPGEWSRIHRLWCMQLQNKGSGGHGVYWSKAATLGSRKKAVTSPCHHPALQAAHRSSRVSFRSRNAARGDVSKNAAMWRLSLMILICFDLCLASDAIPWAYPVLLLFSPIHWNSSFSSVQLCVASGAVPFCSQGCLPSDRNPTAHLSSKVQQSATVVTAMFSLCSAFPAFCFVLCLYSLCVVKEPGQILGLLFYKVLCKPLRPLQSCCRLRPLSEAGVKPRSGEVLRGVGRKRQDGWFCHGAHRWPKDGSYHRKALPWPVTRHVGVQHPPVLRCYTWGGQGLQAPVIEGRKLSQAEGKVWVRKATRPTVGWIMHTLQ